MISIRHENDKNMLYNVSEVWLPHFNGPGVVSVSSAMKIGEVDTWGLEINKEYDLDWKEDFEEIERREYILHEDGLRYDNVKYRLKKSSYCKLMYGI